MREFDRAMDGLREIRFQTNVFKNAQGSVIVSFGDTQVLCTAMMEPGVPPFLKDTGNGWLTAEYNMLPASTQRRKKRNDGKPDGRGTEIQRLIGRSLRSVCDLQGMGEYTIHVDCDVLNADGGTRTASICGAFVAVCLCVNKAALSKNPIRNYIAAVSAGIVEDSPMLDLCYAEDSRAQADMNFIGDEHGNIAEIQICGEKRTITEAEFLSLLQLCKGGVARIIEVQKEILKQEGIVL